MKKIVFMTLIVAFCWSISGWVHIVNAVPVELDCVNHADEAAADNHHCLCSHFLAYDVIKLDVWGFEAPVSIKISHDSKRLSSGFHYNLYRPPMV